MRISLKVAICFMTASVSLLSVSGNKGGPANVDCDNTPVNQTALLGASVTINCNYSRAKESNIRFFCKEDEKLNCTNVISSRDSNHTRLDRFSLTDNKQQKVYTVTISGLTRADAGRYQCAIKGFNTTFTKCLTEVHLHILSWEDVESMELSHGTGDNVQIKCCYPDSHENKEKFLCKGENPSNCEELIHTTQQDRDMIKGRFTIKDNRRLKYFYMYIKNVSIDDSGTYWCFSDRTWQHVYSKIHLSVAEKHAKTKKSGPPAPQATAASVLRDKSSTTSSHPPNSSGTGMIVSVVVSLALLVIAVVVLILCRHKLSSTQGGSSEQRTNSGNDTEGNHGDHNYEEIQENSGNTLPSIYATINLQTSSTTPVSFQKDPVSVSTDRNTLPDTNQNGSSISGTQDTMHPPAAGHPLYSTVFYCKS